VHLAIQAADKKLPAPDAVLYLNLTVEAAAKRGAFGQERYEKEEMQREVSPPLPTPSRPPLAPPAGTLPPCQIDPPSVRSTPSLARVCCSFEGICPATATMQIPDEGKVRGAFQGRPYPREGIPSEGVEWFRQILSSIPLPLLDQLLTLHPKP